MRFSLFRLCCKSVILMGMNITYKKGVRPDAESIISVYKSAGLNRPIDDKERIEQMYANSNLIVSAWDGDRLVGVARSVTDFCFCCYLSDLAVDLEYQKAGVGKKLLYMTKEIIGDQCMLLLLSAPAAMDYYPKIGLEKIDTAFLINRKS
jgi:GNAT superfamily N-acetyltransferase